jgi:16S rRNA processing protein RimM
MTERFAAALLGAPFGLTGRIKLESLSGEITHLLELQKVTLRKKSSKSAGDSDVGGGNAAGGDSGGGAQSEKTYDVEEVFSAPLSIKLKGIDSPEAAKALKGREVMIPRAEAAPLDTDEFYIEDLRGMAVSAAGQTLGAISDVIEGGGGFLAEILLESGEKRLVPFRDEFFGTVDTAAGNAELRNTWILE